MMEIPDLMTVDEVADRLRMGPQGVRRMIRRGELRARKVGKQYLVTPADLLAYLDSLAPAGPAAAPDQAGANA